MFACQRQRVQNLRRIVCRGHKIERRRALSLKGKETRGKRVLVYLRAAALMADRIILAVDAAQREVGEEHRARAV